MCVTNLGVRHEPKGTGLRSQGYTRAELLARPARCLGGHKTKAGGEKLPL